MRTVPAFLVATIALAVTGCGPVSAAAPNSVVAAFYPLAFTAQQIGGPSLRVYNLTPSGVEPHDIELTPRDVARIDTAHVVLYLSHHFQPAVDQAVKQAHGRRVDVLAGIGLRKGVGDEK